MTFALFGTFFILAFLRVPIAISLAAAALVPIALYTDMPLMVVVQRIYNASDSFTMMAVPFFMIAGGLLEKGGVSKRLINLATALVGWLPGGLAVVCFVASAFFGAISGSSTATVIAIGSTMVPALIKAGYDKNFALATMASAGYLGVIIPPSIPMVSYGIATGTSVGDMFMAGFIPGILLVISMSIYGIYYGKKFVPVTVKFSSKEAVRSFIDAIWALLMPGIILGGIYGGIFTPTEAAAVACLYGIIIGFFIYRELNIKIAMSIVKASVVSSGMIMFIIATAAAFGFVMTWDQIPTRIAAAIMSISSSKIAFLMLVNVLLIFVGTFMETNAAILILAPILMPMCQQLGIEMVAFGIMMIVNLSIGMLTPPLGVNLFVAAGLIGEKTDAVINKHLMWYIILSCIVLVLLTYVPGIAMFLPNLLR